MKLYEHESNKWVNLDLIKTVSYSPSTKTPPLQPAKIPIGRTNLELSHCLRLEFVDGAPPIEITDEAKIKFLSELLGMGDPTSQPGPEGSGPAAPSQ